MLEAQKELLQMIIWSIILFQVEKIFLSWQLFSARVSGIFALKKSLSTLTPYTWNVSYLKF